MNPGAAAQPSGAAGAPHAGLQPPQRDGARRACLAVLYLAEGAPLGFVHWFLGTRLASRGVGAEAIGAITAAAVLPWTFKFVWAPAVDTLGRTRLGLRGTVLLAQLAMVLSLLPLASFEWSSHLDALLACVVLHSLCASTQDVAIDAWMIRVTPEEDLGRTSAWMQGGYRSGMWLFGYGLLAFAHDADEATIVYGLIVSLALAATAGFVLHEPRRATGASADRVAGPVARSLGRHLRRRSTWIAVGFALTAGAGFEAAGGGLGRLLVHHGHSEQAAGFVLSGAALGLIPGGLFGGWLSDRRGQRAALLVCGIAVAASVLILAWLEAPSSPVLTAAGFGYYTAVGGFTAASYAWFAARSRGPAGGSAFSLFMGATNGCESWAALALGTLLPRLGWSGALSVLAAIGLVALAWLWVPGADDGAHDVPRDELMRA